MLMLLLLFTSLVEGLPLSRRDDDPFGLELVVPPDDEKNRDSGRWSVCRRRCCCCCCCCPGNAEAEAKASDALDFVEPDEDGSNMSLLLSCKGGSVLDCFLMVDRCLPCVALLCVALFCVAFCSVLLRCFVLCHGTMAASRLMPFSFFV